MVVWVFLFLWYAISGDVKPQVLSAPTCREKGSILLTELVRTRFVQVY